jgi:hypothetical protein
MPTKAVATAIMNRRDMTISRTETADGLVFAKFHLFRHLTPPRGNASIFLFEGGALAVVGQRFTVLRATKTVFHGQFWPCHPENQKRRVAKIAESPARTHIIQTVCCLPGIADSTDGANKTFAFCSVGIEAAVP